MFGEKLKHLRESKQLFQKELGDELGVTSQTISGWEIERTRPDYEMLQKIANYFNVSIDYLLDNEPSEEFKEQSEENKKLLNNIADDLQDPTMKALYSKASELKNDRDRKMVLNVIKGFMEDVDNNEQ